MLNWKCCLIILFIIIFCLIYYLSPYKKEKYKNLVNDFIINKNKLKIISYQNKFNKINVPIYYINLDRSPQRKKFMEEQFDKYNIFNYQRITGIDGKNLNDNLKFNINGTTFINNYKDLTKNEIGCLLSHLKAIITAYDNDLDEVLILEDDCSFDLMFFWKDKLTNILDKLNKPNWDIIKLYTDGECLDFNSENCSLHTPEKGCWGCVAYLINKKGMEKIIDFIKPNDRNEIILGKYIDDKLFPTRGLSDIFIYQIAKTYYLEKPLFFTDNSELQSNIEPTSERDLMMIETSNIIINHFIKNFELNQNTFQ